MKVLVAYASKHGSTKGIAEFVCQHLRERGLEADVVEATKVNDLDFYDAFVIGSALYLGQWMGEAKQLIARNRALLSSRPVWLFSSGPTGTERKNAKGLDLLDPKVSGPMDLDKIEGGLRVMGHRVFFGAFDLKDLGFFSRQFFKSETIRKATPTGDFRDWNEIKEWSDGIADRLLAAAEVST